MRTLKSNMLICFFATVVAGCVRTPTALTETTSVYAGEWVSDDGARINILSNGGGRYLRETDYTSTFVAGKTVITDSRLKIKALGIGPSFKIDAAPHQEDGRWVMQLDGVIYTKTYF